MCTVLGTLVVSELCGVVQIHAVGMIVARVARQYVVVDRDTAAIGCIVVYGKCNESARLQICL